MIFILYNPFNRHYKKPILSLHLSLQHKKGGVHNRSNQLEPRHYRISRLNTT